jgi:hypothetical protein
VEGRHFTIVGTARRCPSLEKKIYCVGTSGFGGTDQWCFAVSTLGLDICSMVQENLYGIKVTFFTSVVQRCHHHSILSFHISAMSNEEL